MTSKDSKESYKCTGKKIVPRRFSLCFLLLLRWTSTDDFLVWSRTMLQALQNNNPLLLSTNVCFWYSQCLFFFADVLVGILGLLDFGVDLHVPLLLSLLLDLVVDSLLLLAIGVLGIGLLVLVLWGLLVLGLTPETETTTTNLSIVSLVSKEAQISLSNDVVM